MDGQWDVVVVGLGYVGLPLAVAAAAAGMQVAGLDQDAARVAQLRAGTSYIDDVRDEEIVLAGARGFVATVDPAVLTRADAVVICVPTPLRNAEPDLSAVLESVRMVASRLRPGALVVLESTTYPGTTTDVVLPILAGTGRRVGADFLLAYSPERIDPGNPGLQLSNTPKIVGGVTARCAAAASELYGRMVQKVVVVSNPAVAELAKLLENTYRQVNIALVNDLAVYCARRGIDVWEVVEAACTKPFGFHSFRPGPGVGGHCIPVDPMYLTFSGYAAGHRFRLVEQAQEINERMPHFVVDRIVGLLHGRRPVRDARILLLGATYKPDLADDRGAAIVPIAEGLIELGAAPEFHDPYVRRITLRDRVLRRVPRLDESVRAADIVVLLQPHSAYDLVAISDAAALLFDTSGRVVGDGAIRL